MTDPWTETAPFRPGAARFEVRNEASIVYFFDEANRAALKKTSLGRLGSDASPKTVANLAKKKLFAEFVVTRDVTLYGFVALGPQPTAAELAGLDWRPPRVAALSLPSGQLRMETAGSFSLGPELAEYAGLFIEVPPGEYTLTLVEVNDPSGGEWPQLLLTLTPADGSGVPADATATTRPAEPPPLPLAKYAAYTIDDGVFHGLLSPDDTFTNFDERAARLLGLHFGSPLRVRVGSAEVDAYFLANATLRLLGQLGDPQLNAANPLVSQWVQYAEFKREGVLYFARWSGGGNDWLNPRRRRWRPITITRSTSAPLAIGPPDPGECSVEGGTLRGRVVTCSPTVLTLNVSNRAIAALGDTPPDPPRVAELLLTVGGQTHRLTAFSDRGSFPMKRLHLASEIGDTALGYYQSLKRQHALADDPDAFVAAVGEALVKQLSLGPLLDRVRQHGPAAALEPRPFPGPPALLGATVPHWTAPERQVLWVEAAAYARDEMWHSALDKHPAPHGIAVEPGAEVILTRT
jgi:hypothetical protein